MSALPSDLPSDFSALSSLVPLEARLVAMRTDALAGVMEIENAAYDWPWSQAQIADCITANYHCLMLVAGDAPHETVLGYFLAMPGVDEVHLLNITINPAYQGQGWGRVMLDALALWARADNAQCLWLELRVSNTRALKVYETYGFRQISRRKAYYPTGAAAREDALVMRMSL